MVIQEVQREIGPAAANRLARAIDREYVLRRRIRSHKYHDRGEYTTYICKTCGGEFRRRPYGYASREYCDKPGCRPSKRSSLPGEKNARAKLTWEQVDDIRANYKFGLAGFFANKYGVSKGAIADIIKGENWKPENDPRRK